MRDKCLYLIGHYDVDEINLDKFEKYIHALTNAHIRYVSAKMSKSDEAVANTLIDKGKRKLKSDIK